jgi:hypothetical protein
MFEVIKKIAQNFANLKTLDLTLSCSSYWATTSVTCATIITNHGYDAECELPFFAHRHVCRCSLHHP